MRMYYNNDLLGLNIVEVAHDIQKSVSSHSQVSTSVTHRDKEYEEVSEEDFKRSGEENGSDLVPRTSG